MWLFPPRRLGARESGVAVLSAFVEDDPARRLRALHTLHYETEPRPKGEPARRDELAEQGTVPLDRVERILAGVLRRLDRPETPEVRETGGDAAAWAALLDELRGGGKVDAGNRESLSLAKDPEPADSGGS